MSSFLCPECGIEMIVDGDKGYTTVSKHWPVEKVLLHDQEEFTCDCGMPGHEFVVRELGDDEFSLVSFRIRLNTGHLGFWGRVKVAMTYIFRGIDNIAYEDVLLNQVGIKKLIDFLKKRG